MTIRIVDACEPIGSPAGLPIVRATEIRNKRAVWLWADRLRVPSVAIMGGRGESGKSSLAAALAAHVTGGPALSLDSACKRKRGAVLWLTAEENVAVDTKPRLKVARARLAKVYFPGLDGEGQVEHAVELPGDLGKIEQVAADLGVVLIVVDPLASYCPAIDLNQQQPVRALMGALKLVSDRVGLTWLLIVHPNKSRTGSALDRLFGSGSIHHFARHVLLVAEHPDGSTRRVVTPAKNSGGDRAPTLVFDLVKDRHPIIPRVRLIETANITPQMLGVEALDAGEMDEHVDALHLLRRILKDGPKKAKEVMAEALAAGVGERTLRKAKAALRVDSQRVDDPHAGPYWQWLPPACGWPVEGKA